MADSNILKEFFYKISFLTEGSGKAKKDTDDTDKSLKKLAKSAAKLALKWLALAKIVSSATKYVKDQIKYTIEMNDTLENQAKSLKKTNEQARAHLLALKAMGKTMDEINKDKNLKARYDELIKLGEAMQLPDGANGIRVLDGLRTALDKLKVAGSYVFQWIYYYWQQYVREPIEALTGYINELVVFIQKNVQPVAKKIAEFIAKLIRDVIKVIKDLIKIVQFVVKIVKSFIETFKTLPQVVQAVAIAFTALFAMLKNKTALAIGIILIIILLIDDFITYVNGGQSAFSDLWDVIMSGGLVVYNFLIMMYNLVVDIINGVKWAMNLFRSSDNQLEMSAKMNYYSWKDGELVNEGTGLTGIWNAQKDNAIEMFTSGADLVEGLEDAIFSSESKNATSGKTPNYASGGDDNSSVDNSTNNTTINVNQTITGSNAQAIADASVDGVMSAAADNLATGIA